MLLLLIQFSVFSQIQLRDNNLNESLTNQSEYIEDKDCELTIEDALKVNDTVYKSFTHKLQVLDFNSSRWFIKFSLENLSSENRFIIETARPITNRVILYEVSDNQIVKTYISGDDYNFDLKNFKNRKNLYLININYNETKKYYLEVESDGEVVNLPLRIWREKDFYASDYNDQFLHGIYYGILLIVIFIFSSFYALLKERVYLMYVIYVVFQFLLQFSLDGYAFQYFFSNSPYWTDRFVIVSAGGSIIFVMLYASFFLRLKENSQKHYNFFKIVIGLAISILIFSLLPTPYYEFTYPVINAVGLIGTLSIITALSNINSRKIKVDPFFTLGFVLLIAGAVVFILGNFHLIGNYDLSESSLKISSLLEILALSISMARRYKFYRTEKQIAQKLTLETLQEKNKLSQEINARLENEVLIRTNELQSQRKQLEEVNKDLTSSIIYAQRIQQALLPTDEFVTNLFPKHFIINKPRDIVSGDFYFVESVTTDKGVKLKLIAVIDCTGHGVPGAFMSLIGNQYLKQSLKQKDINSPAEALDFLNRGLQKSLKQNSKTDLAVRDGMDMALCGYNDQLQKIYFAGAKNSIYIIRDAETPYDEEVLDRFSVDKESVLLEYKADRHPIGSYGVEKFKPFTNNVINVYPGDKIYLFSDGYMDQFGGPRNKKFGSRSFKELLIKNWKASMEDQKLLLEQEYIGWKGDNSQLDDILVIGFEIVGERVEHS